MSKAKIAEYLFRMKREGNPLLWIEGDLFSADELLSRLTGQQITEDEGYLFIAPHAA